MLVAFLGVKQHEGCMLSDEYPSTHSWLTSFLYWAKKKMGVDMCPSKKRTAQVHARQMHMYVGKLAVRYAAKPPGSVSVAATSGDGCEPVLGGDPVHNEHVARAAGSLLTTDPELDLLAQSTATAFGATRGQIERRRV